MVSKIISQIVYTFIVILDIGAVAFGLPCEANYRVSAKTEIKRLQIKMMNQIVIGVEQGLIDAPLVDPPHPAPAEEQKQTPEEKILEATLRRF